jgi:CRP-like cAMP-binding protein
VAPSASAVLPWLEALPERDQASLVSSSSLIPYRPGASIFSLGDEPRAFEFVVRGRVRLLRGQLAGDPVLIDILEQGELLCGNVVYQGRPYCCDAAFDGDGGALLAFERRAFLSAAERCPAVARILLDAVTCRGSCLCSRLVEVGPGKSRQRIAKLLGRLADDAGEQLPTGEIWIPIRMSRKDLAQMCSMRMETVIRVMTQLQRDEVLTTEERGFVVRDREALRALELGD